jgi:hypothetical protein
MSVNGDVSIKKGQTGLLRTASIAAFMSIALIPGQFAIWIISPPPETAEGFLKLYVENPLQGILNLDLPLVINCGIVLLIYIALFVVLRRREPVLGLLALVLGSVAMAAYFPSNTSIEMYHLSRIYASAGSGTEQTALVAAANLLLAVTKGTGYSTFYVVSGFALLFFSIAMLRTDLLSRFTS